MPYKKDGRRRVLLYSVLAPLSRHKELRLPLFYNDRADALRRVRWLRGCGNDNIILRLIIQGEPTSFRFGSVKTRNGLMPAFG